MRTRLGMAAAIVLLTGCGQSSINGVSSVSSGRPAEDLPARFDASASFGRVAPEDTLPGSGCLSPMHDPRNDTRLVMRRADRGIGDYEVTEGKYGVKAGELLRLNCNTGEALGIVRR